MDDAARTRRAAREALADVDPDALRRTLDERLADASMTPGVLTALSARTLGGDEDIDGLPVAERAAGVQLIYEGLRLTRTLAQEEPWSTEEADSPDDDIGADLSILAADVFVARGFYLLARTTAADRAVETVRAFGRDQTLRREEDGDAERDALDRELEVDVFGLAVVAGATAAGQEPPGELLAYAEELAREQRLDDGLAPATALPDAAADRIASLSDSRVPADADG